MAVVSMKQFLEAGVHFGHQTSRWNPKMRPYIFGARNGIHIIDLQKSLRLLKEAYEYVLDLSSKGESVLFVGTKMQAREIIREEAVRSNSYFINERWLGGLLTNFNTIKASVNKMRKLEEMRGENGLYEGVIKKEALKIEQKRIKLEKALGGIKEMRRLPGAIFVVDCKKEKIAIQEANKLNIPVVAVVDTNCDPDNIKHVIPGNDDAIRAIRLFSMTIANAAIEGRAIYEAHLRSQPEEKPEKKAPAKKAAGRAKAKPAEEGDKKQPIVETIGEPVQADAPAEEAPVTEAAAPVEAPAAPAVEAAAPEAPVEAPAAEAEKAEAAEPEA